MSFLLFYPYYTSNCVCHLLCFLLLLVLIPLMWANYHAMWGKIGSSLAGSCNHGLTVKVPSSLSKKMLSGGKVLSILPISETVVEDHSKYPLTRSIYTGGIGSYPPGVSDLFLALSGANHEIINDFPKSAITFSCFTCPYSIINNISYDFTWNLNRTNKIETKS